MRFASILISRYGDGMSDGTQSTTVRMPVELHDRLRREAFETRTPANEIMVAGVRRELDERDRAKAEGGR
jgi:hypothetical protein